MAGAGTVIIKILGDAGGLKRGLDQADGALTGFSGKVDGFQQRMGAFGNTMTTGVTLPVIGFLGLATAAAIEDESAQRTLAETLKNTTGATNDQVAAVEAQIEKMTTVSTFADDDLRPAFAALVTETRNVKDATDLMTTAMDLAAAKNITVEAAAQLLIQAHNGQTRGLAALGIETKNAEGTAASFGAIMGDVNLVVGGQAAAALETTAGKTAAMKRDMGELTEEIGVKLLPVVSDLVTFVVDKLLPALDSLTGENGAFVLLAVAGIGPATKAVEGLTGAMTFLAAHPVILVLAALVEELIRLKGLFEDIDNKVKDKGFLGALKGVVDIIPIIGIPKMLGIKLPGFAAGGTVPGPVGAPMPILAHGGEEIVPLGRRSGGVVNNFSVTVNGWVGDDVALTRKIIAAINGEARRGGAVVV